MISTSFGALTVGKAFVDDRHRLVAAVSSGFWQINSQTVFISRPLQSLNPSKPQRRQLPWCKCRSVFAPTARCYCDCVLPPSAV